VHELKHVIGYVRVSTLNGALGDSIDAQGEAVRSWARSRGWQVVGVGADLGRSGTLDAVDRPGLLEAVGVIERGEASVLAVHRLDRLARALHVQEAVLARVWASGGEVWEAVGDRQALRDDPEDPMRTFVRQVMGAAGQLERGLAVARLQGGRRRKAERGGYAGGWTPYGFERVGSGRDAALTEVPEETAIVARIRKASARGLSLRRIAELLNRDGVPAKAGGEWGPSSVRTILARNEGQTQGTGNRPSLSA
jgi:DNA invertase Pin-like site-specific DNA recombinase